MHSGNGLYGDDAEPADYPARLTLPREETKQQMIAVAENTATFLRNNAGLIAVHGMRSIADTMRQNANELMSAALQLKVGG